MSGPRTARIWHLITALIAGAAVLTELGRIAFGNVVLSPAPQLAIVSHAPGGSEVLTTVGSVSTLSRMIRFLSYFTVESNILVAVSCAFLAISPAKDGPVWRVVRLSALFGITVTMVTYVALLAPVHHPTGLAAVTNVGLHYVSPILAILGWILFGPRPRIDQPTLVRSLTWPAAYMVYTLIHGAATKWYPYPFVDAVKIGYATAIRNGIGLGAMLIGVGSLYMYADGRIGERRRSGHGNEPETPR